MYRSRQRRAHRLGCNRDYDRPALVNSSNERFYIHDKSKIVYCGKQKMLIFAQSNKQNILYLKNRQKNMKDNMPETQNIEYKSVWKDEYLKRICGFANAQVGTLFIGKAEGDTLT
jgi:hypothetical protein